MDQPWLFQTGNGQFVPAFGNFCLLLLIVARVLCNESVMKLAQTPVKRFEGPTRLPKYMFRSNL